MRELHVVALSEDGRSVLLATTRDATRGGFRVALDERLAAAIRGDLPRPGEQSARDSTLTPKEIQARLRAGASPAEIAREAGVAVARVERFSGPVLSERAGVVAAARAAHVVRGRRGRSLLPLGEAVSAALAAASGYREDSEDWTTRREEDGRWTVTVSWFARARTRTASWSWDGGAKELVPVDTVAASLGYVGEAPSAPRRTRRPAAGPRAAATSAAPRRTAERAGQQVATPAAKPAAARATKPAAARATKPAAARATKPATKPAVTSATASPVKATGRSTARPVVKPAVKRGATALAAPVATGAQAKPTEPTSRGRTRASVPGWADVLLGTDPRPVPRAKR